MNWEFFSFFVCLLYQDAESSSQNPQTPNEIRCKTIDETIETAEQIASKETTAGVTTPAAKTKPKAPLPPIVSNSNRPAGDAKQNDVPSGESDVITTTSSIETPVPANDASKSDIPVAVEISKSIDPKAAETPSKRKAPSKPLPPEATSEGANLSDDQFNVHYEPGSVITFAKDEPLPPDTSHVSIVTIDDNGKDVTITSTSQVDELANDDDEGHADSFNSFSNSSSSRSSDRGKIMSGDTPPSLRSDDVIVLKDRATAKEVIIVSNEQVSKVTPSTSDDQISIKTESSESSDGHFPFPDSNRKSVHVAHDEKKAHSVAVESKETSRKVSTPVKHETLDEQSISDRRSRKNGIDPVLLTSNTRTAISSSANGVSSSSSPPVSQNNLRREASDAGSCGSFVSVNSDKENLTSADSRLSPGVVLRRKKVSSRRCLLIFSLARNQSRCLFPILAVSTPLRLTSPIDPFLPSRPRS